MAAEWTIRIAEKRDIPAIETLIPLSVRALQVGYYSKEQMEAAIGPIFGVDHQLIEDRTYYVAEAAGDIVGCGGWSRRKSTCGSSCNRAEPDPKIDPRTEAPRIRAFFVHPNWARRGIGRAILQACEHDLLSAGFTRAEIAATTAGEPLYSSMGYQTVEHFDIALSKGLPLPCVRMSKEFLPRGT